LHANFACSGWRGEGAKEKKTTMGKAYLAENVAGNVHSVARKSDEWLLVEASAEARRMKWPKWWLRRGERKKNWVEMIFSQLWLLIFPPSGYEIHLYL
jgi:hypothetical protein